MIGRIMRRPGIPLPPAQRELFDLRDSIQANEQIINQLLNQIGQLEARLPPATAEEVRELSDTLPRLHTKQEELLDQLGNLRAKYDELDREHKRITRDLLLPQQHRITERHENHKQILDQLSDVSSQLSDQVKRYEDKYGELYGW